MSGKIEIVLREENTVVKFKGFRLMKMPLYGYIFVLKPLVVGLIPAGLLLAIKKKIQR